MKAVNFTYDFLFSKRENGEYNYIVEINPLSSKNILYGKEIFVPANIDKGRNNLFQALGYIGAYGNNEYDESIHYLFMPQKTVNALMLGTKNDFVIQIEDICDKQKKSYKNPKAWSFKLKFILESEVLEFLKGRSERINDILTLEQVEKYESSC